MQIGASTFAKRLDVPAFQQANFWTEFFTLNSRRENCMNLGLGFPNFPIPKYIKKAAVEAIEADLNQYTRSLGHPRFVSAIAKEYSPLLGRKIDPMQEVLVSTGAAGILYNIMEAYLEQEDEAVVFDPHFDFYKNQILMTGAKLRGVPLVPPKSSNGSTLLLADDWTIDFDALSSTINEKTKIVIVNSPLNPLGKVLSKVTPSRSPHFQKG